MRKTVDPAQVPAITLRNGDKIPAIGMGTFGSDRFTPEQVSGAVAGAVEVGYRLFDCAAVYGNEDRIGEVFQSAIRKGTVVRDELTVMSKVWNDMHGAGDVLLSLAQTLKDLQMDYVDVLFVHWPFRNYHAPGVSVDARSPDSHPFVVEEFLETWRQLEQVKQMGLVRHIGMSNMTIPKLEAVLPHCEVMPALTEMELHPCFQQPELFDYLNEHGIQPVGFCPIGSPTRPDRDMEEGDASAIEDPTVVEIAQAHNVHPAIICIKWAVQRGQIPIPFSIHENEYYNNLYQVTTDPLTDDEMKRLQAADQNCRLIKGHVFLWEGAKDWRDLWDEDGEIVR